MEKNNGFLKFIKICLFIMFLPVAITYLIFKSEKMDLKTKLIVTAVVWIFFIAAASADEDASKKELNNRSREMQSVETTSKIEKENTKETTTKKTKKTKELTTTPAPTTTQETTTTQPPTTTQAPTTTPAPTTTQPPTTTPAPTQPPTTTPAPTEPPTTQPPTTQSYAIMGNYVVNTNTGKFHLPGCSSADDIYPENRWDYYGNRQDLINQGYQPCKRCNP